MRARMVLIEAEGDGVAELLKSLPAILAGQSEPIEATVAPTPNPTATALPAREDARPKPEKTFPRGKNRKSRFLISSDKWQGELSPSAAERALGRKPGTYGVALSAAKKAGRNYFGDREGNRFTFRESEAAPIDTGGSAGTVGAVEPVQA